MLHHHLCQPEATAIKLLLLFNLGSEFLSTVREILLSLQQSSVKETTLFLIRVFWNLVKKYTQEVVA